MRGLTVGYRAIEDWAARGLAPAPTRRSLGRGRGTVSEYPADAVNQYTAVASVMRRGLPWQVSVLKLLVRGHLPRDHDLVRQALHALLVLDSAEPGSDALDHAERIAAQTAATPVGRSFLYAFERNLRRSAFPLEPGAEDPLRRKRCPGHHDPSCNWRASLEHGGSRGDDGGNGPPRHRDDGRRPPWPRPVRRHLHYRGLCRAFACQSRSPGPAEPDHFGGADGAEAHTEMLHEPGKGLPLPNEDFNDVLTVFAALMLIRIEDLGGDDAMTELVSRAKAPAARALQP